MKVFLSHSTKDKQFVETLAAELEAEKIGLWLCEVDIELGDNFVAEIEKGLREADLTVLFWSPEAARSDWTRLEWTSVTAREISESRTRLGIVLLHDCAVPELLRVKHRIDARTDPEKARHETVAWIKRLRDMRRLAETGAPGVFLPPPPHDFVGRAEALEMLYATLKEEVGNALLHGEPGCGKSTLALKFAWQTQGAFDAVVLIDTRLKIPGESIGTIVSTHGPRSKRMRHFKSGCEGSGVKDHVPTKIVTLKVRLGDGEHVNPAVHLFQEGEKSGQG